MLKHSLSTLLGILVGILLGIRCLIIHTSSPFVKILLCSTSNGIVMMDYNPSMKSDTSPLVTIYDVFGDERDL